MSRRYSQTAERVYAESDGETFFDTDAFPVQFVPTADELLITGRVIEFPDFEHDNAYSYARGLQGDDLYEGCASYVSLLPGNWGPVLAGKPTPDHVLADEVLGTVPGDADQLLVYINATRTNAPDQINGEAIPLLFKEGAEVYAPGGSLAVEYKAPMARTLWIGLAEALNEDGTRNVLLRRRQSVSRRRYYFWRSGNDHVNSGWTYGAAGGEYGHIVKHIQSKGPVFSPSGSAYNRFGSSKCSLTDTSDYATTLTADIRIIPGRSGKAAAGSDEAVFGYLFEVEDRGAKASYLFEGLPASAPSGSRYIEIGLASYSQGNNGRDLTSVTIGGVVATQLAKRTISANSLVAAIYGAIVPDGTEIDVEADFSNTMMACRMIGMVAYNLDSTTPVATRSSSATTSGQSLATAAGGLALAVGITSWVAWTTVQVRGWGGDWYRLLGIEGSINFPVDETGEDGGRPGGRAFQITDGSTLSIRFPVRTDSNTNPDGSGSTAWCAVSLR